MLHSHQLEYFNIFFSFLFFSFLFYSFLFLLLSHFWFCPLLLSPYSSFLPIAGSSSPTHRRPKPLPSADPHSLHFPPLPSLLSHLSSALFSPCCRCQPPPTPRPMIAQQATHCLSSSSLHRLIDKTIFSMVLGFDFVDVIDKTALSP